MLALVRHVHLLLTLAAVTGLRIYGKFAFSPFTGNVSYESREPVAPIDIPTGSGSTLINLLEEVQGVSQTHVAVQT